MDAKNPTPQDELHGGKPADGLPSGSDSKPSENDAQGQTITLTQEELQKRLDDYANERHSALDKEVATLKGQVNSIPNLTAELDAAKNQVTTLNQNMTELQQAQRAAELESVKDNPDAYSLVKQRQENQQRKVDLDSKEASIKAREDAHATAMQELQQNKHSQDVDKVIAEYPDLSEQNRTRFKDLLLKYGGNTPEQLRESAKELHGALNQGNGSDGSSGNDGQTGDDGQQQTNTRPAPGATPGAGSPLTGADLASSELEEAKGHK